MHLGKNGGKVPEGVREGSRRVVVGREGREQIDDQERRFK